MATVTPEDKLVVVHSSLGHLAPPKNVTKWDFLYAIDALLEAGKTIALPTFTFGFCRGEPFHKLQTPSETGRLGDWVLSLRGAKRTPHPIYSFTVAGPLAPEIYAATNTTTFGEDSVFALFEKYDARLVMLGCDWSYCTQFHRYEEDVAVAYRRHKIFEGTANFGDGDSNNKVKMYVRDLEIGATNDFSTAVRQLAEQGNIRHAQLWRGEIASTGCAALASTCRAILKDDPWSFVANAEGAKYRASLDRRANDSEAYRVALLGSSNLELVKNHLEQALTRLMPERRVKIFAVPYGQLHQQVFDSTSSLHQFAPHFSAFIDRLEDLTGVASIEFSDSQRLDDNLTRYLDAIAAWRENSSGWISVNRLAQLTDVSLGRADPAQEHGIQHQIDSLGRRLDGKVAALNQCVSLDLVGVMRDCNGAMAHDPRLWFLGRYPFSDPFSQALAERLAAMTLAAQGKTARVIAVDLDNTVWGGVLGEDGIEGLKLGGDYPGNTFEAFQKTLKKLSDRGIALVLCSKNDEDHALNAMASLPNMVLQPDDFVGKRINWTAKWQNVAALADELNISPENILFIDDNPVEREQMRQHLPQVKVLDLPSDPASYGKVLLASPWIECLQVTTEDTKRVANYAARQAVQGRRTGFTNMNAFYASLGTILKISPLGPENSDRAVQLINKTNQFNTTTKRYTRQDLDRLIANSHSVYVIGAEDKFSDFENIGVLIVNWHGPNSGMATVDSYLLSCRVLGRGIENGVIRWLADTAQSKGMTELIGPVVETERNRPARNVFADAGFFEGNTHGEWRLDLRDGPTRVPTWLEIRAPKQAEANA